MLKKIILEACTLNEQLAVVTQDEIDSSFMPWRHSFSNVYQKTLKFLKEGTK